MEEKKKKKRKNNEANWMVSNSAKLDSRTKQHTQLESLRVTVPEISRRQNRGGKKEKNKNKKNNEANWVGYMLRQQDQAAHSMEFCE